MPSRGLPPDAPLISISDHLVEVPEIFDGVSAARRTEDLPHVVDLGADAGEAWVFGDVIVPVRNIPLLRAEPDVEPGQAGRVADIPAALREPAARLAAMDRDDVRTHVLFPQVIGFAGEQLLNLADSAMRVAACRAYNDYVAEVYHAAAPTRLLHVAVVPMDDADLAAKELHRAAAAGARGVTLPCNPAMLGLPSWHEPRWDPLLDAAVEHDVPVFCHIATMRPGGGGPFGVHGSTPGAPIGVITTLSNLDVMTAVTELAFSPVLVRHPDLRIVVVEGGAGWLPYLRERIDFSWGVRGDRARGPGTVRDRPPSQLLERALILAFIDDPAGIRLRDEIGVSRLVWMSDFPHEDGMWPHSRAQVTQLLGDVPEPEARAFTAGNAAALLHLEI
jgi:predicted TIM-barrel fold metal-dependent hydrolase